MTPASQRSTAVADPFKGRRLAVVSKHRKELAISPVMDSGLGVSSFAATAFDTDLLGTFTGEVPRKDDPLTTLRRKCLAGMHLHGCDLGIASEGSFGPHPVIPFVTSDEELLILIDAKNDLQLVHRELSTDTNFSGAEVGTPEELSAFAEKALFPSHALILRDVKEGVRAIEKGIRDWDMLIRHFHSIRTAHGTVYAETDMRAMHNPTRMRVIGQAAKGLLEKLQSHCPLCDSPGFLATDRIQGLPCSLCGSPTRSVQTLVFTCGKCGHGENRPRPDGRTEEDPMYCDWCNP